MNPAVGLLVILSSGLAAVVLLGWVWALLEPAWEHHEARLRVRKSLRMIRRGQR